jgi:hypothetical protein
MHSSPPHVAKQNSTLALRSTYTGHHQEVCFLLEYQHVLPVKDSLKLLNHMEDTILEVIEV